VSKTEHQKYVVGFLFNEKQDRVLLIKKERPSWQKDLWNGVGGKIEEYETRDHAMIREFKEETGLLIDYWRLYAAIRGVSYTIYFYSAVSLEFDAAKTTTDEMILDFAVKEIPKLKTVPNLIWLVPMALDKYVQNAEISQL
jgi:8-oxo-dGTP diphosphatase